MKNLVLTLNFPENNNHKNIKHEEKICLFIYSL